MEWRTWIHDRLAARAALVAIVPVGSQHPAGAIDVAPDDKPFIEVKTGDRQRGPYPGAAMNFADIWVHDAAGTYMTIDQAIEEIKAALGGTEREAQVSASGGISARWIGDSQELADDGYGTICKYTTFQLNGREQ